MAIHIVHTHHVYFHDSEGSKIEQILTNTQTIMTKLTDLEALVETQGQKITALQGSLDAEQEQIKGVLEGLNSTIETNTQTIVDLRQQLIDLGADEAAIARITEKFTANNQALDDLKTDLEGTIKDEE